MTYHVVANGKLIAYHDTLEHAIDFAKQYSSRGTDWYARIFNATGMYITTYVNGRHI